MAKLMSHMFKDSKVMGDQKRFKVEWTEDIKLFLAQEMAAGAAAQFMVSKKAILQRPLIWWQKLLDANRGQPNIGGCNHRDYAKGTEVASAMERYKPRVYNIFN